MTGSTSSHAQFRLVVSRALKKPKQESDLRLLKKLKLNAIYLAKETNESDSKTKDTLQSLVTQIDEAISEIHNQKQSKIVIVEEGGEEESSVKKNKVEAKITDTSSTTSALKLQTLIKKQKVFSYCIHTYIFDEMKSSFSSMLQFNSIQFDPIEFIIIRISRHKK